MILSTIEWLFEIKWDGYRAIAFIAKGKVRLVSRNQNDLHGPISRIAQFAGVHQADTAILDGEIAVLDGQGRSSFSLIQQRTGIRQRASHRFAPRYSGAILRVRPAVSRRVRSPPGLAGKAQSDAGSNYCRGRSAPVLRAFSPGQGAVQCCQAKRAGGDSSQAPEQCLRGAPQPASG
jgi:hypothetical protein